MLKQELLQEIADKIRKGMIMGYNPYFDFYLNEQTIPQGQTLESVLDGIGALIEQGQKSGTNPDWFITFEKDELPLYTTDGYKRIRGF